MVTDDCEFLGHISTIDPNMWLREQKVLIDQYFFSVNINSLVYCIIYYKKKRNINSSLYYGTTYNRCVKNPKFSSYFSVSISWSWILKPGVLKFMGFPGGLDSK